MALLRLTRDKVCPAADFRGLLLLSLGPGGALGSATLLGVLDFLAVNSSLGDSTVAVAAEVTCVITAGGDGAVLPPERIQRRIPGPQR